MRTCGVLVLLGLSTSACEPPRGAPSSTTDARVAAIDSGISRMRRDTATVLGLSTEGAWLEAAYEGPHLRRLYAEYLGETGRAVEAFYFDTAAFFVMRREFRYDAPLSGRVVDSTMYTFDLTRRGVSIAQVDSLNAAARLLLQRIARPEN